MINDDARRQLGECPAPRSPEQGITDMQARILHINGQLRQVAHNLSRMGSTRHEIETLVTARKKLQTELQEAEQRLREYEAQKEAKN